MLSTQQGNFIGFCFYTKNTGSAGHRVFLAFSSLVQQACSSLLGVYLLKLVIKIHFFQLPVQWLLARLLAQKDKCRSINYTQVIEYTHHYCNLQSVYSVLYLCTRAAAVHIFTGTYFLQWLSLTKVTGDPPVMKTISCISWSCLTNTALWKLQEKLCTILKEKNQRLIKKRLPEEERNFSKVQNDLHTFPCAKLILAIFFSLYGSSKWKMFWLS